MGLFQMRYAVALIAAITIDALQFLLGAAIAAAFFHPATAGAIIGCVISSHYVVSGSCWLGAVIGGVAGAAASFVPLVGQALMATTDAIGAGLSALVDFCFSCIGFAIIIPALIVSDIVAPSELFVSWRRGPSLILKIIPGIDMLPFFTGMVVLSILECEAKKKASVANVALAAATGSVADATAYMRQTGRGIVGGNTDSRGMFAQSREKRNEFAERVRARAPLVDGIRAPAQASAPRAARTDTAEAVSDTPLASAVRPTLRESNSVSRRLMERPA